MERDGRLSIIVLTGDAIRAHNILRSISHKERLKFTTHLNYNHGILYSGDAVYRIAEPNRADGMRGDQVILDRVDDNYLIAKKLLTLSCVPEEFQIIDGRVVLN